MKRASVVRWGDVIVIVVLLVLAGGLTVASFSIPDGGRAIVLVDGERELVLPLGIPGEFTVQGARGETRILVENGGVCIVDSACPHKTCVHMGTISIRGQVLICVPNHVAVRIEGGDEESGVDGVTG